MAITRETDGDAAEAYFAGGAAFWAGRPYAHDQGDDWRAGWLAAALDARRKVDSHIALIESREKIVAMMTEAYAALKAMSGLPKLTPSNRTRCRSALEQIGATLPHLGMALLHEAATERHRLRGRA